MKKLIVLAALAAVVYGGMTVALQSQVAANVDKVIALMPPEIAVLSYEGVSSGLDGRVGLTGLKIVPGGFRDAVVIDEISIKFPNFWYVWNLESRFSDGELPDHLSYRIDGMAMAAGADFIRTADELVMADASARAALASANCLDEMAMLPSSSKSLGYSEVVVDGEFGYTFVPESGQLQLHGEITQRDAYRASISVDFPLEEVSPIALAAAQGDPSLHHARIEVEELGYYARLKGYCNRRDSLSSEDYLIAQQSWFDDVLGAAHIKPDQPMLDSYLEFVEQGGTFSMELRPREPLKFDYISLYHPEMVPDLLNIKTNRS